MGSAARHLFLSQSPRPNTVVASLDLTLLTYLILVKAPKHLIFI